METRSQLGQGVKPQSIIMDVLDVRLEPGNCDATQIVRLFVNGRDLTALVREFEAPFASELAGAYGLLPAADVLPPARHFLGEPEALYTSGGGRTMLLGCDCGEPGCWPLEAHIAVNETTVRWQDFSQPHRPEWNYGLFGPFNFDRGQYEEVLGRAAGQHRAAET